MFIYLQYVLLIFLHTHLLTPPAPAGLHPPEHISKQEGIVWSQSRKLSWDDFQSEVDSQETLHAMTATNIDVKAHCYGNLIKYDVKSVFVTEESWSKNKLSAKLLAHEQLHFDLTEIHARLLRKKLSENINLCSKGGDELDKLTSKQFSDWKQEQDQYDEETNHGLDEVKQKYWEALISLRLHQLKANA